jgi:hypothetical protein
VQFEIEGNWEMADNSTVALIAAGGSLIVAVLSGLIALWNGNKTNANSLDIQNLKGVIDEDLEKLKAKLSHGQIVSSTQWNAEFASYQAIWKGIVAVRIDAQKVVLRESELRYLGLPEEFIASLGTLETRRKLIQNFVEAAQALLSAVHDNAPFYPAAIRKAANDTHQTARQLIDKHMTALTHFASGTDIQNQQFTAESEALLLAIVEGVDRVESLIRERLAAVEVVNSVTVQAST